MTWKRKKKKETVTNVTVVTVKLVFLLCGWDPHADTAVQNLK